MSHRQVTSHRYAHSPNQNQPASTVTSLPRATYYDIVWLVEQAEQNLTTELKDQFSASKSCEVRKFKQI